MQKLALRVRALGSGLVVAAVLSACGGGGDSPPPAPPAPTVVPDNLSITAPATAESATAVAFGNSAGTLAGLKYQWDFGDGATSSDAAPSHSYASGGEFEVVLKVSNDAGASRETRTKVNITNIANVRGLECTGAANTGWCWQNPKPTGNRVNTVFFLNASTGWRGGENGEIFKTSDGGTTWVRQPSGVSASIYGIRFLNATTGWATGAFGALLRTTDGGSTWTVGKLGDSNSSYGPDVAVITPLDAKTVFVGRTLASGGGSYGYFYASKDGGITWQTLSTVPHMITSSGKFWSLQNGSVNVSKDAGQSYTTLLSLKLPAGYSYFEASSLWPQDDQRAVVYTRASGYDSSLQRWVYLETVYTTVDAGANWSKVDLPVASSSIGLQRVLNVSSDGKGLLASGSAGLMSSSDGGRTWTAIAGPSTDYYGLTYTSLGGSEVVATSYSGLWLSKDQGQTWTRLAAPSSQSGSVAFVSDSVRRVESGTLTASDNQGSSYLSKDDGQTWTRVVAPIDGNYGQASVAAFADARNGLLVDAAGKLFATKDGGATWEARNLSLGQVRSAQFVTRQTAWAVSGDGRLYKSTDAGQTWATAPTAAGVNFSSIFFQNETLGWSQRNYGGAPFAFTRDGGKTWTELALPSGVASLRQGEQVWVAVGSSGAAYVSTDAGATWNAVYTGTSANLSAVAFSDARNVWAVGAESTLLKSEDAGARWSIVKLPGAYATLRDVKFANAKVGWIVGDAGLIFSTVDGGKTWRQQPSGTVNSLMSIQVADSNTAWITGTYGTLLATGTGGN